MVGAWRGAVVAVDRPTAKGPPTALVERIPTTAGAGAATFRRLIEVPGCRLRAVLRAWWQQAEHGDGYLRLDVPRRVGDAWSLSGVFRKRLISRRLPVELLLSPYKGRWTLLELMPRRMTRPNRVYFRAGHRSLDWFEAALDEVEIRDTTYFSLMTFAPLVEVDQLFGHAPEDQHR